MPGFDGSGRTWTMEFRDLHHPVTVDQHTDLTAKEVSQIARPILSAPPATSATMPTS